MYEFMSFWTLWNISRMKLLENLENNRRICGRITGNNYWGITWQLFLEIYSSGGTLGESLVESLEGLLEVITREMEDYSMITGESLG